MIVLAIVAVVVVVILVWVMITFNRLVRSRNQVADGWAGIDVQLTRRADLVPVLVETVKGYRNFESGTLVQVVDARGRAINSQGPAQAGPAEAQLAGSLKTVFATAEAYPDLKADASFRALQRQLSTLEEDISFARRYYNAQVRTSTPASRPSRPFSPPDPSGSDPPSTSKPTLTTVRYQMPTCRLLRSAVRAGILVLVWLAIATTGTVNGPTPAWAHTVAEAIDSYHVDIDVQTSGTIHVREVINYQFGIVPRHGIERQIPVRFRYDGRYDRIDRIDNVVVSASPGTPTELKISSGNRKYLRIGDPDKTITGAHQYVIDYDVNGALNAFGEHDELYWNAIGNEWTVPIGHPSVIVTTPVPTNGVTCFAGPQGSSSPCASTGTAGSTRTDFSNPDLVPSVGLTVVVSLPKGAAAAAGPILDERWTPQRAFAVTPVTLGGAAALLLLGAVGLGLLFWRQGRDRRAAGGYPAAPSSGDGPEEHVPLFADRDGPVIYRPPEGLRPAQLGVLLDESADPLDVTATIVDLAVRGYLTITEIQREHRWSKSDWLLTATKPADDELLPYERDLFNSIFEGRDEVALSDMRDTFHGDLVRIEGKLYDDSVAHGWFAKRPDKVRSKWLVLGILISVVGAAAVGLAAGFTHAGLVPVPILLAGLVLTAGHRWTPARTAKGSAALSQILGFRRYIETAEADRMQFAEQENVWATYLPYAIVFGATKKWARAFEGLGADQQAGVSSWYISPYPFSPGAFSTSMDSFAHSTSGAIVSTPSSSGGSGFSGGFSGGGGGGGGGGSW